MLVFGGVNGLDLLWMCGGCFLFRQIWEGIIFSVKKLELRFTEITNSGTGGPCKVPFFLEVQMIKKIVGFLRGGCSRGGNWGTLRIPNWGTLGNIWED